MSLLAAALITLAAGITVLLAIKGIKRLLERWVEDVFSNWYEE